MKFFMPVYAVALTLAVTSEQASAALSTKACTAAAVCPSGTTCVDVIDTKRAEVVAAPKATTDACATGKFAYVKSIQIVPDVTAAQPKNTYGAWFTKDGTTPTIADATIATAIDTATVTTSCDNSYVNLGKYDATANVKAIVGCPPTTDSTNGPPTDKCVLKYKIDWACQVPACGASDATFTAKNVVKATPFAITRPAVADLAACPTGKVAYLSGLQIGADKTTKAEDFTVTFASGVTTANTAGTAFTATPDISTCETKWTDVGKTATSDIQALITCSATSCDVKYKATWVCQTADTTPAPTTAAPSSAVTYPVAAWGTALVAAVAGANFAAPL